MQTHSLQQSHHPTQLFKLEKYNTKPKYKCKNNRKFIYLIFIHCKFEKHKQSFLSENYEQTFPNKKHKQSNARENNKQSFPGEN